MASASTTHAAATPSALAEPALRIIEQPAYLILVVPDANNGRLSAQDRELIGLAHTLSDPAGGAVCVVLFDDTHDDLSLAGADRVLTLQTGTAAGAYAPDAQVRALVRAVEQLQPAHVLFPESQWGGSDRGRRLAAQGGFGIATGVWRTDLHSAWRYGDGGTREIAQKPPLVMVVREDAGEALENVRYEAARLESSAGNHATAFGDRGMRAYDPQAVSLEEAEFILSAGNGVSNWQTFHTLAATLGASEGGSRVVVDAGALPRDRQIGATGSIASAKCYIALGISGAPQHLQGITTCEHVIAVNRDPACDMVKRANLAIIADCQPVMEALLAETRKANSS